MRKLAAGEISEANTQPPWALTFPSGIPPVLLPFVQSSGDFPKLAEALKTAPRLLWHPLVYRIIKHLRDVRSEHWDDELTYQVQTTLRQLVEAAASGLLGGAWSLKPPPGQPGRKKSVEDMSLDSELCYEAEGLMESLRKECLRRRRDESEDQRALRVAHIVEQVWERSSLSRELLTAVASERTPDRPATLDDFYDMPLQVQWKAVPLPPPEKVLKWVRDAYEQSSVAGRPVRSQLVWKMLAHRYGLSTEQVRGRIDTARAWEKKTK